RGFIMHALDHFIVEAFGSAAVGVDQAAGPLNLARAPRKGGMTRRNLVGMDQALSVEAKPTAVFRFGDEPLLVVEAVEDSVERPNARGGGRDHDPLERYGDRLPP